MHGRFRQARICSLQPEINKGSHRFNLKVRKLADVGWSLIKTKETGIKLLKLSKLSQDKHNLPAVNLILSCLLQADKKAFKFQDSVWFSAQDDGG